MQLRGETGVSKLMTVEFPFAPSGAAPEGAGRFVPAAAINCWQNMVASAAINQRRSGAALSCRFALGRLGCASLLALDRSPRELSNRFTYLFKRTASSLLQEAHSCYFSTTYLFITNFGTVAAWFQCVQHVAAATKFNPNPPELIP